MFAHLRWADERTLTALRGAPPPADCAKALEIYGHVLGAEQVWLARLRQAPATVAVWPRLDLDGCARLAQESHAGYSALLAELAPADLSREVPYTNSAGVGFRSTVQDILIHVAMHGSYHRGQVALLLRQAGAEPTATDYIAFVRGAPAATRRP